MVQVTKSVFPKRVNYCYLDINLFSIRIENKGLIPIWIKFDAYTDVPEGDRFFAPVTTLFNFPVNTMDT